MKTTLPLFLTILLALPFFIQAQENDSTAVDSIAVLEEMVTKPDYDEDGFHDAIDRCPYEYGTYLGCPEEYQNTKDSDGDGISDDLDKCPLEKGTEEFNGCKKSEIASFFEGWNQSDLISYINNLITTGKSDDAEDALIYASEKFTENIHFPLTLGQLYINNATTQNTFEEKKLYYEKSAIYYSKVIDLDNTHSGAYFNLGVSYFNQATLYNEQINELSNDFSNEGIKKYDELAVIQKELIIMSKPYFEEAFKLDEYSTEALDALHQVNYYLGID